MELANSVHLFPGVVFFSYNFSNSLKYANEMLYVMLK